MIIISSPGTLEIRCLQCFQRCRGQHLCPGITGHEMCNYTVGINCLDNLLSIEQGFTVDVTIIPLNHIRISWQNSFNTRTVSSGSFCDIVTNTMSSFVLCRHIQAVRRLKAQGQKLMRTVHLMFVPGRIFGCFFSSFCNLFSLDSFCLCAWAFSVILHDHLKIIRACSECAQLSTFLVAVFAPV